MSDSSLPHASRPDPDDVRRDATEDMETSASPPDAAGEPPEPSGAEAHGRERGSEANGAELDRSELDRSEPASPPSDAENLEFPSDGALPAEGSVTTAPSATDEDPAADEDPASDENEAADSAPLDDRIAEAPPQTTCANCDAPLVGPYCAQCGQRAAERIVPLHEMTREWVEDLFEFDIRIFRTLPTFFFKPGRLTDEYVRGRRVRYVRPLRLYLVSSFILFSLLAFSDFATIETEDDVSGSTAPDSTEAALTPAQVDSLVDAQIGTASPSANLSALTPAIQQAITSQAAVTSISGRTVVLDTALLRQQLRSLDTLSQSATSAIDSIARATVDRADVRVRDTTEDPSVLRDSGSENPDPEDAALPPRSERSKMAEEVASNLDINLGFEDPETEARAKKFLRSRIVRVIEDPNAFLRGMIDRAPIFMFLLLPLFAFLLKLLYIRRGKLYVQHLIFALHVHALFFLVFSVVTGLLLTEISALHTAAGWLSFTPFAYLYIAMQHVYKQGWIKTGIKLVLLMFTYNTFLFIGVGLLALANFLLMG